MKFRKKPAVIDAIQWTGDNQEAVALFLGERLPRGVRFRIEANRVAISAIVKGSLERCDFAYPGDWIIRGVQGELYPCRPDTFAATYEPA
ncbi:hypothetical protein NAV11_20110 [Pseudomonas songnenensis]|uniref:Uncharacterized protein n=1 Tax=Pseudomonas songnenensis TaxID=1176259 RepID=A0ABX9UQM4_9PSED|nr:hypothetical protein [Pseudomonas songnenensis]MCQ4302225.1 hypothetical protein [Pseudomonas songnenensis]RMH95425.1 hypothetical protein EA798_16685 [Pseudomonas songnenensis]